MVEGVVENGRAAGHVAHEIEGSRSIGMWPKHNYEEINISPTYLEQIQIVRDRGRKKETEREGSSHLRRAGA